MADGSIAALSQLRDVKARRERRARSALCALVQREEALRETQAREARERAQLRDRWRACSATEQTVDHSGLQSLKIELATYSASDQALTERLTQRATEMQQIRIAIEAQRVLLREAARDQEKLDLLIESGESGESWE